MRVIGGTAKGRRLFCPKGRDTRPTPDLVRGSLFNILGQAFSGERVLDLFSGTGALSIEALSRGAGSSVMVEAAAAAVRVMRRNVASAGFEDRVTIYEMDVERALPIVARKGGAFDLIFAGPPYAYEREELLIGDMSKLGLLAPEGIAVFQHSSRRRLPDADGDWGRFDTREFGGTNLSFYSSDTLRRRH